MATGCYLGQPVTSAFVQKAFLTLICFPRYKQFTSFPKWGIKNYKRSEPVLSTMIFGIVSYNESNNRIYRSVYISYIRNDSPSKLGN